MCARKFRVRNRSNSCGPSWIAVERCDAEVVVGADPGRTGRTLVREAGADAGTPLLLKPTPAEGDRRRACGDAIPDALPLQSRMPLDDAMSQQIFDRYLDALDGDRLFFTQADIDRFGDCRETKLDDAIYDQDLSAPFAIFNLYEQRVGERIAYARDAAASKGFDFSQRRELPVRPRKSAVGRRPRPSSTICGASASRTTGCALQARRQERQGHPRHARQALRELSRSRAPAQQRRRVPDVHERLRDVDRAAHQLSRPARERRISTSR